MSISVGVMSMDIVIDDRELAFAPRGTWAMRVRNVYQRTLKLVVFAIQKCFVPMIVQEVLVVNVTFKRECANAMNLEREMIALDLFALDIMNFVPPVMRMDALDAKMDSVLTRQQNGESNANPVGDLIHVVELAVKMLVRRVLICYCYPSIDLGDARMIHPCRWTSYRES